MMAGGPTDHALMITHFEPCNTGAMQRTRKSIVIMSMHMSLLGRGPRFVVVSGQRLQRTFHLGGLVVILGILLVSAKKLVKK